MSDEYDCGDSGCMLADTHGGMRTNGGCRCLDELPAERRWAVMRRLRERRALLARLEQAERERDEARAEAGRYANAVGRIDCALGRSGALPLDETVRAVETCVAQRKAALYSPPPWLPDLAEALGEVRPCDGAPLALNWTQALAAVRDLAEERDAWRAKAEARLDVSPEMAVAWRAGDTQAVDAVSRALREHARKAVTG